jgi:Ras-related protein Rab-18
MMYRIGNHSTLFRGGSPSWTCVLCVSTVRRQPIYSWRQTYVKPEVVRIVVGNKVDKEFSRQVSTTDGREFAERQGALFVEASAKTAVGVSEAFEDVVRRIIDTPALWDTAPAVGAAGKDKLSARSSSSKPMPGNITLADDDWEEEPSSRCSC